MFASKTTEKTTNKATTTTTTTTKKEGIKRSSSDIAWEKAKNEYIAMVHYITLAKYELLFYTFTRFFLQEGSEKARVGDRGLEGVRQRVNRYQLLLYLLVI